MDQIAAMINGFDLPADAVEQLQRLNAQGKLTTTSIEPGVTEVSGHDKGVAYRFFTHQDFQKEESKKLRYEKFKTLDMIEWYVDEKSKTTERINMLPETHLKIEVWEDEESGEKIEEITGIYADAYKRWKEGLAAPGLSLTKWEILTDSEIATLHSLRIYTVEQFAATPRAKIQHLPKEMQEKFERAILHINSRKEDKNEGVVQEMLEANKKLEQTNTALKERIEAMEARNEQLVEQQEKLMEALSKQLEDSEEVPKKRGRPRKTPEN